MRASVAVMACLAAWTTASEFLYRSWAGKGVVGVGEKSMLWYFIPTGQCSGFIDFTNVCSFSTLPLVVRIAASDNQAYPQIDLRDDLNNASIYRREELGGYCGGPAFVKVKLHCLGETLPYHKVRQPLPQVPAPSGMTTRSAANAPLTEIVLHQPENTSASDKQVEIAVRAAEENTPIPHDEMFDSLDDGDEFGAILID